jgi:glycerol-3-phosphate dehydrogenase
VAALEDTLTGSTTEVRARVLVNASGPWSDAVRKLEGIPSRSRIQGSKGAHVAVSRERVGNHDALTLLHPKDGRVMFALPAGPNTIIGTTDTFTDVSPDDVRANETDVSYLLEAANTFFPEARLHRPDVIAAWAGIRPLMPSSGTSVQASREHAIERGIGSVTITGGKLTTYRVMAREVVDVVQDVLEMPRRRAPTDSRPLPNDGPPAADGGGAEIVAGLPYRPEQMAWAVEHEMACTLGDLLIRRTHIAFETRDNGRAAARTVAESVAPLLRWDERQRAAELSRYDAEVERLFTIDT